MPIFMQTLLSLPPACLLVQALQLLKHAAAAVNFSSVHPITNGLWGAVVVFPFISKCASRAAA